MQIRIAYMITFVIKFLQNSSTYWEGNAKAESLQRIYGISFPDAKQVKKVYLTPRMYSVLNASSLQLDEWKHFQEEAAKRDHRKIGRVSNYLFIL